MQFSERYFQLQSRVEELRKNMLPFQFSPIGDYNERQLDKTRGFRLLTHAEIESYLEDRCRDVVMEAVISWSKDRVASGILISLLSSFHSGWNNNDEKSNEDIMALAKQRVKPKESANEVITLALKQFVQKVGDNHGVRNKNLKTLIFPLGVDLKKLDNEWLTNLDEFGKLRGEVAHKTKSSSQQINPRDELERIEKLLLGLGDLDQLITELSA